MFPPFRSNGATNWDLSVRNLFYQDRPTERKKGKELMVGPEKRFLPDKSSIISCILVLPNIHSSLTNISLIRVDVMEIPERR